MNADIKTIILIIGIFRLVLVLVFFYQFLTARSIKGPGWWLAWSIADSFGSALMLMRNIPGVLPVVIVLQNPAIAGGSFLVLIGVLKFLEIKTNLKLIISIFIGYYILHLFFFVIIDNSDIRTFLLYIFLFGNFLAGAVALLRSRAMSIVLTTHTTALFLLLHAAMAAVRIFMLLSGVKSPSMFESTPVNYLIYFDALVVSLLMVFGFINMVSEKLNFEISQANQKLSRTNAEKDKLFSIIAHDLVSPFNLFLGMTEMMAEEDSEATIEDYRTKASALHSSASGLYKLLDDLLYWSRMQRGLITFMPESIKVNVVTDASLEALSGIAEKKGITIINKINTDTRVFADKVAFQLIIRNIVSNGIKFTPRGGTITLSDRPGGNNMVEISIRDSGIGMSTEMVSNLLRVDSKTSRTGTEGEPGTGLGLIICKDLLEKNSGILTVSSEENKGSEFCIKLMIETT